MHEQLTTLAEQSGFRQTGRSDEVTRLCAAFAAAWPDAVRSFEFGRSAEGRPMRALLAGARRKQPALLQLLRRLVESESPSNDKSAVDACMALAASHAQALGARIKLHRQRAFGNVLEARFGPRSTGNRAARPSTLTASSSRPAGSTSTPITTAR